MLVCLCLIGLVLLQRSEGGALGMGGGGGSLVSGRGAADALARMTQVAGGFFLVTSLGLTFLSGAAGANSGGGIDLSATPAISAPASTGDAEVDAAAADAADADQIAALTPAPPEASATAPPVNSERAAPLPINASAPSPTTTRPPTTTPTPRPATSAPVNNNRPLVLPDSSGSGAALTLDPAQLGGESGQTGDRLEAVRRERAGPDQ